MAKTLQQTHRLLRLTTPLGKDALILTDFFGEEGLSQLYYYDLQVLSQVGYFEASQLLGQSVSFSLHKGAQVRYFHGLVAEVELLDKVKVGSGEYPRYGLRVVPPLWLLSQNQDSRIGQNQTVEHLVKSRLADWQLGLGDWQLQGTAVKQAYTYSVQYNESDYAYLARLLAREGIYYAYTHQDTGLGLRFSNSVEGYRASETAVLDYTAWESEADTRVLALHEYASTHPSEFLHNDYNFQVPGARLLGRRESAPGRLAFVQGSTQYHYGEGYARRVEGERFAQLALERADIAHNQLLAETTYLALQPGETFRLQTDLEEFDYTDADLVIKAIRHEAKDSSHYPASERLGLSTTTAGGLALDALGQGYWNELDLLRATRVYRPPYAGPREVSGTQPAVVVGIEGKEIDTDVYGRVKVQFQWDRRGQSDEHSSCWLRVAQDWAGNGWGNLWVPRIGEEVLVGFECNQIDRPLVLGSQVNGQNKASYPGQAHKNLTTLKSHSTPQGEQDAYNELRFDDSLGSEVLSLQAQRDLVQVVERDAVVDIHQDEQVTVGQQYYQRLEAGDERLVVEKGDAYTAATHGAIHYQAQERIVFKAGANVVEINGEGIRIEGSTISINPTNPGTLTQETFAQKRWEAFVLAERAKSEADLQFNLRYHTGVPVPKGTLVTLTDITDQAEIGKLQAELAALAKRQAVTQMSKFQQLSARLLSLRQRIIAPKQLVVDTDLSRVLAGHFSEAVGRRFSVEVAPRQRNGETQASAWLVADGERRPSYVGTVVYAGKKSSVQEEELIVLAPQLRRNFRDSAPGKASAQVTDNASERLALDLNLKSNPDLLTPEELAHIKAHGNNVLIFVHGYNVPLGELGRHIVGITKQTLNPTTATWPSVPQLRQNHYQRIEYADEEATIYRDEGVLEAFDYIAPSNEGFESWGSNFKPETLNGSGALGWLVELEYLLNKAASEAIEEFVYDKTYTRILGIQWAGDPENPADFIVTQDKAKAAGRRLACVLAQLKRAGIEVSLLSHSMGAGVLLEALETLATVKEAAEYKDCVANTFLWQPAVPSDGLNPFEFTTPYHTLTESEQSAYVALRAGKPMSFPFAHQTTKKIHVLYSQHDNILGPLIWPEVTGNAMSQEAGDVSLEQVYARKPFEELLAAEFCALLGLTSLYSAASWFGVPLMILFDEQVQERFYEKWIKGNEAKSNKSYAQTWQAQLASKEADITELLPDMLSDLDSAHVKSMRLRLEAARPGGLDLKLREVLKGLETGLVENEVRYALTGKKARRSFFSGSGLEKMLEIVLTVLTNPLIKAWVKELARNRVKGFVVDSLQSFLSLETKEELVASLRGFACLYITCFKDTEYTPVAAMGYSGVDKETDRYLGDLSKLEQTDQTKWFYHHSDMRDPTEETLEKSYRRAIYDQMASFGRYKE